MVSAEREKYLKDLVLGSQISKYITIPDQIAACRKEIDLILEANTKIAIDPDYAALSTVVAAEKEKQKRKTEEKPKK